ncbi:SPOR domain-containing protein [Thioalbus denitrificans]|uniref:Cell division protein FtsN n=1 Tax=Thioalbus denitrificans TaxID=547122 RepID=A0A369CFX5_9GAMM|nr:SPOR domain-containing protein [Thioalbus denitrificans]RCX32972.1 cell division protein FtsN [Thioalbus denitrificans]
MARDYNRSSSSRRGGGARRRSGGSPRWQLFVAGLIPGLLVALLVYLEVRTPDAPRQPRPAAQAPARPVAPVAPARPAPKPGQPAPGKKPEPETPRFEFYTILPEMEVVVPDKEVEPPPRPAAGQAAPATPPQPQTASAAAPVRYFLQAGSFRRFEDADRVKAQLALLGLVAGVQRVTINGGEAWHRVRLGPYTSLTELERVRALLKDNGISSLLLKEKG